MQSQDPSKVIEAYNEMFLTEGWKLLLEDFKKNQQSIGPTLMSGMPSIEQVYYEKGRNDVWQYCLTLKDYIELARKQLEEPDTDE